VRWRFDGEGTDQSPGVDTEVILDPVLMAADPFRGHPHKLILCQCLKQDGTPIASNTRDDALRYLRARADTGEFTRAAGLRQPAAHAPVQCMGSSLGHRCRSSARCSAVVWHRARGDAL